MKQLAIIATTLASALSLSTYAATQKHTITVTEKAKETVNPDTNHAPRT